VNIADKITLRTEFRQKRQQLSASEQRTAQSKCCKALIANPHFKAANRIGFYLANDGEVSPQCALNYALKSGKRCYLPRITPRSTLEFAAVYSDSHFVKNHYAIDEPVGDETCPIAELDLLLLPLVAFDKAGNRLGMGGGYYDRALAQRSNTKPRLIGLAHCCQEAPALAVDSWDIPLESIIAV
jgi:5-formyltetrahydrofolate cyclo-ligase